MNITDEQRTNMAANLVDFLLELESKVARDSDSISIEGLTDDGRVVGAIVLIRGTEAAEAFIQWATENGYCTVAKASSMGRGRDRCHDHR